MTGPDLPRYAGRRPTSILCVRPVLARFGGYASKVQQKAWVMPDLSQMGVDRNAKERTDDPKEG